VTGIQASPSKKLMLFAGRSHPVLAQEIAKDLKDNKYLLSEYSYKQDRIFIKCVHKTSTNIIFGSLSDFKTR
jgi:hypothetical protein